MFKTCRRFDVSSDFIVKLKDNDVQDSQNVVMFLAFFIWNFLTKYCLKSFQEILKNKKKTFKKWQCFDVLNFFVKSKDKYLWECRINVLVKIC